MSSSNTSNLLLPGQPLPLAKSASQPSFVPGEGTFARGSHILSSLVGEMERQGAVVSVKGGQEMAGVPEPESVVIGKITRITSRQATLSIQVVDGRPCREEFQGVIRVQDIRATEKDKVKVWECFRPGDIVRASVISLGDARSYYLSTAHNSLGVIFAVSSSFLTLADPSSASLASGGGGGGGNPMEPISWCEMRDPKTGRIEKRKCAKPAGV